MNNHRNSNTPNSRSVKSVIFTVFAVLCITNCTSFERSQESGQSNGRRSSKVKKVETTDNLGTSKEYNLDSKKSFAPANSGDKTRVQQLENSIVGKKEIEQYSKALPWFRNDQEKIEFLQLKGFEDKQRWLQDNHFIERSQAWDARAKELIDSADIALGMPSALVKKSWGEPENIEVAGNPAFKNERWRYQKYVSTPEGFKQERKTVYFEGGKVVGWEME